MIVLAILLSIIALYILICAGVYLYQEIRAEINKLKRNIMQTIWDIEWEIKLRRK